MNDKWYTQSAVGIQNDKLNPMKALDSGIPGIPGGTGGSGGADSTYLDAEQLVRFASDVLELVMEFSDNLRRGIMAPMAGDGGGNPGAGYVPSSGLLYEGSIFADKYSFALRKVQEEFPKHLNGLQALYAVGVNAAAGFLNGDHNGGRDINALMDDAVPAGKGMFTTNGEPSAEPAGGPTQQAREQAALQRDVNEILGSQRQQTDPAVDGDGEPISESLPDGPSLAGTPGYQLPTDDDVRDYVMAGGRENDAGTFDTDDGMLILRDDEGIEITTETPK